MAVNDQLGRNARVGFCAIALVSLAASIVFILANRLPGLGYFDGSEYALHIQGGGIAHAPGYPLFIVLGKAIHAMGADGFLAQQLISVLSICLVALALFKTFALEVGIARPGFAAAFAISIAGLGASYYLRLFAILPEVFILNVGLFALLILAITRFGYDPKPQKLAAVFFVYGLGVCHHHTLAFTLPACLYLIATKVRRLDCVKSVVFSLVGLVAGCLPLIYLFAAGKTAESTYYRVHDLQSLLFVLLRKGYGTFHLSPLNSETDIGGLYSLAFQGLVKNFNTLGLVAFIPLIFMPFATRSTALSRANSESPKLNEHLPAYGWKSPSLIVSLSALVLFFVIFIPNCNLELGVRTYRTIFLRFLTIPCFLLTYIAFKAALRAWDWSVKWGARGQISVMATMLVCIFGSAIANGSGLRYRNCDLLDEHVRSGYSAIFSRTQPEPSPVGSNHYKCLIFAQGDTLLMGIKYYNEFVATRKCFVFSSTSLTGQFLNRSELQLASRTLEVSQPSLESGQFATRPEALLNLFLKLDKLGYGIFVFSVTDFTGYFGKMFVNSPFAYRPVGNILQVVTSTSAPFGMDQMVASYESYVIDLEVYVRKLQVRGIPSEVVDSQANQALILNLTDYAKFARFYPAPPDAIAQLLLRAESVQAKWLALVPRE